MINRLCWKLCVALLISSCCHKSSEPGDVIYLPPSLNDYEWFQFPEGFRIYQNQFGVYDTMIAYASDTVYNSSFVNLTNEKKYNSCETLTLQGFLVGEVRGLMDNGTAVLTITSASHELYRTDKILLQVKLESHSSIDKLIPIQDTILTISGTTYTDVSVVNNLEIGSTSSEYFKRLYYSKTMGLIKYVSPDNGVWELTN